MVNGVVKVAYAISLGEGTLIDYGYAARPPEINELNPDKAEAYQTTVILSASKKFKDTGQ